MSVPSSDWVRPPPLPPPRNQGGNTNLQVRGWADPIRTTEEKAWHSVYSMPQNQHTCPSFQRPSADHLRRHCHTSGNFLKRLALVYGRLLFLVPFRIPCSVKSWFGAQITLRHQFNMQCIQMNSFLHAVSFKYRARIYKRLWCPGIDSKEWIPPAYVAWRAGTIILFLLGS